jgi:hypothetical protein
MAVVQSKGGRKKGPQKPEQRRVDEQIMEPGQYEVGPDDTFTIHVYVKQVDKRWVVVRGEGDGIVHHEVVFRMWNYHERVELRKKATKYDRIRRMHLIDNDALNQLKIQKYMKSWTFDRDNPRLKLHHIQGTLTDEGWVLFVKNLNPSLAAYIIDEMNRVYEANG